MWTDEFHTLGAVQKPWGEMIRERLANGHLPTYFILQKAWVGMVGTADWAMRFPSAVYGALLVPMVVVFAWRSVSRALLWALLGMAVLNGTMLWASQEARMYSLLAVAATACHWLYWRTVTVRGVGPWAAYFAALVATATIQPVILAVFPAHLWFSLLIRTRHPQHWRITARLAVAALIAIVAGLSAFAVAQTKYTALMPRLPDPLLMVRRLGAAAFGARDVSGLLRHIAVLLSIVGAVAAWIRWRRVRDGEIAETGADPLFIQFCAVTVAGFVLLLVAGGCLLPHVVGVSRYLVPVTVPAWVVIFYGFGGLCGYWLRAAVGLSVVVVLAGAAVHWHDRGLGGREVVRALARRADPGDVVILSSSSSQLAMIQHYGATQVVPCRVPSTLRDTTATLKVIRDSLRGRDRAWVFVYRDDKPRLQAAMYSRPDWFRILREYERESAKLVLIEVRIPPDE